MEPLVNMRLSTNEISIKNNHLAEGQFKVSPRITRNIEVIDESHSAVELILEIINSEENPFPIDIRISLNGVFDISNLPSETVDNFLKVQAVQIMFPYVRTIVSSITSCSLMPPIVLPIIDVKKLFPDND